MAKSRLDYDDYSFEQIMQLARIAIRDPKNIPDHVYKNMECDLFSSENTKVKKLLEDKAVRAKIKRQAKEVLMSEKTMKDFFRLLNSMKNNHAKNM